MLGEKGKQKGKPQPDSSLRDTENVPLTGGRRGLLQARGAAPCAGRLDRPREDQVGYEIPFNRHFYVFEPPRELAEIDADLKKVTDRIMAMIEGLSA